MPDFRSTGHPLPGRRVGEVADVPAAPHTTRALVTRQSGREPSSERSRGAVGRQANDPVVLGDLRSLGPAAIVGCRERQVGGPILSRLRSSSRHQQWNDLLRSPKTYLASCTKNFALSIAAIP